MRTNATVPRWDESQKLWIYRPSFDGRQIKIVSRKPEGAGYQECIRKFNKARAGIDRSSIRLEKAWEEFLEDRKARLGPRSDGYRKANSFGHQFILPVLKNKRVGHLTAQDWQNILNSARALDGSPLAKKSIMNIRGEITAFCKYSIKAGLMDQMPFDLTIPKTAPVVGKHILQPSDIKLLLDDDSDSWWLRAWQLQLVTGLRPGECLGLHRHDVQDGLIVVRRSINSKNEITHGKNKNALRTIVQTDQAAEIIARQIAVLDKEGVGLPWLFPDPDGCQPVPTTVASHWKQYASKFSVPVTQYCLRHTFVSIMQNDLPEGMLKDHVGHSKSMDTLGVYGHRVAGVQRQAAKIITGVFSRLTGSSPKVVPGENEKPCETTPTGLSAGAVNGT